MAVQKRLVTDLDVNSTVTWNNESNAFTEDDSYADSTNFNGLYYGGCDFADISYTPTGFVSCKIRFFDILAEHADDTYQMKFYNNHTTSWDVLETFNSGNLLPSSLTTKDYSSAVGTAYTAASNKTQFLNQLKLRLECTARSGGWDAINMGWAWAYFEYNYSEVSYVSPISFDLTAKSPVGSGAGSAAISPETFQLQAKSPVGSGAGSGAVAPESFQFLAKSPVASGAGSSSIPSVSFAMPVQSPAGSGAGSASVSPVPFEFVVQAPVGSSGGAPISYVAPIPFSMALNTLVGSGAGSASLSPISFVSSAKAPIGSGAISVQVAPITWTMSSKSPVGSGAGSAAVAPIQWYLAALSPVSVGAGSASVAPVLFNLDVIAPVGSTGPLESFVAPIEFSFSARPMTGQGYVLLPMSEIDFTAIVGKNRFVLVSGPVSLNAGDRIQALLKVTTTGAGINWLKEKTLLSVHKL